MLKRALTLLVLPLTLLAAGCEASVEEETADDSMSSTADAITSSTAGEELVTTTGVRFREGPGTSYDVIRTLSAGTKVTSLGGAQGGFIKVKSGSAEGWVHGNYLSKAGSASNGSSGSVSPATGETFRSKGTGYYPSSSSLEGGFVDRKGAKLRTLQQYLNGQATYVSVAMDTNAFGYGQKLRIKELEAKYGRQIEFRVVDTGGAFRGKGRAKIDICVANYAASIDSTINSMLTVVVDD
jgi:3D (Asp-Asp-Asp) domain-containing protein